MLPVNGQENAYGPTKFDIQDSVVSQLRRLATVEDVCVLLVVHPRKEDERVKLSMASIFGSAKVTQEADTVLLLHVSRIFTRYRITSISWGISTSLAGAGR